MNFFFRKKSKPVIFPRIDVHSHVLPGIDDGAQTIEDSIDIIKGLSELGYKKIITTPHIMADYYPNTPKIIHEQLKIVRDQIAQNNINMELEAAAEYYLDEFFFQLIENKEELLLFGDNYLLFETGFMNKPYLLEEAIFMLKSLGINPILAHPERYTYIQSDPSLIQKLHALGVLFQVNMLSIAGYYSKAALKIVTKLQEEDKIHFIGSDCHNMKHLSGLQSLKNSNSTLLNRILSSPLLNNSL